MNDLLIRCETCAWWLLNPQIPTSGECRAGPPVPAVIVHRTLAEAEEAGQKGYVVTVWPATLSSDRCRAWMPRSDLVEQVDLARQTEAADLAGRH